MNDNCWFNATIEGESEQKCLQNKKLEWCDENCPVYKCTLSNFKNSGLPKKFWYPFRLHRCEKDKKVILRLDEIRKDLQNFVQQGKNLLLYSSKCGNGKTSWGIKLLQKQIELNCNRASTPAVFVYTPQLLIEARKNISGKSQLFEYFEYAIQSSPLVMFDDIACINLKDYDLLLLSNFIETRINEGKSCIFTTNLTLEEIKEHLGHRLYDRVVGLSETLEFKSTSMRGKNE